MRQTYYSGQLARELKAELAAQDAATPEATEARAAYGVEMSFGPEFTE